MNRIDWIDHLKAFGIVLVVYGHSLAAPAMVEQWIYAFHMPLFFFLSGYLFTPKPGWSGCFQTIRRCASKLLPPYLFFAMVGYVFWLGVTRNFGTGPDQASPWLTFLAIPYGSGSGHIHHLQPNVLWFFTCLLSSLALSAALLQCRLPKALLYSLLVAGIGFSIPQGWALPFEIETALVAQFFICIGYSLKQKHWLENISRIHSTIAGTLLLIIGSLLTAAQGQVDMRSDVYGNPLLFLTTALTLIAAFILLTLHLPRNSISSRTADATLYIFPLHMICFTLFSGVYVYIFKWDLSARTNHLNGLIATLLICGFLTTLAPHLLQQCFPYFFQNKAKSK